MRIKLLLCLLALSASGFSQNQINSFYGTSGATNKIVTTASPLNHGAGGTNQTWSFGSFLNLGTSTYTYVAPTASESSTYPGTNNVIVTSSTEGTTTTEGRMFTKNTAGTVSITGLNSLGMTINFNGGTNNAGNATLGAFPLVYPFTNTDNTVSGTFIYGTNSGTFSGSLTTTVDGYGVLNLPDYGFSANVTRLKIVLSVTLYVSIFPVGTASQTTYAYYNPNDATNNFIFRSVNTVVVASAAGINENITSLEVVNSATLGNANNTLKSVWVQNPVQNNIEINTSDAIENANIRITDMLGKTIYHAGNQTLSGTVELPASLNKGIYLLTISNEDGSITKKLIKN